MGAVMGTPVLHRKSGHHTLRSGCAEAQECLPTGAMQILGRVKGRNYSHPLPKLGSVLMGFVFFFHQYQKQLSGLFFFY